VRVRGESGCRDAGDKGEGEDGDDANGEPAAGGGGLLGKGEGEGAHKGEGGGGIEHEAGGGVDDVGEAEGDAEEGEQDNDGALAAREGAEVGTGEGGHGDLLGSLGKGVGLRT